MKERLKTILKTLFLFILFFSINDIAIDLFKIDISIFNDFQVVLYFLGCDLVFLLVIISFYNKTLKNDFKPFFKNFLKNFEEAFKYYFLGLIIMITSNLIITLILEGGVGNNEEAIRSLIDTAPLIMLFEVSIYAPFAEELLFRKSIKDCIKNKWLYIFTSSFIFGALHVTGGTLFDLLYLIPYCSLGFAFAYIYAKSDNIYSTISMHAMHNATTMILYLIGANL